MNYEFKSDVFVSGTSATISATAIKPVVPSATTYIVPEQTLTASDFELIHQVDNTYVYETMLTSSFPTSDLYDGYEAMFNVNGSTQAMTYRSVPDQTGGAFVSYDDKTGILVSLDGDYKLNIIAGQEMPDNAQLTLSLYTSVPEVEPKWQTPSSGALPTISFDSVGGTTTCDKTYSELLAILGSLNTTPCRVIMLNDGSPMSEGIASLTIGTDAVGIILTIPINIVFPVFPNTDVNITYFCHTFVVNDDDSIVEKETDVTITGVLALH